PNGAGDDATFGGAITADRIVTQTFTNLTLGSITFNNSHAYTVDGKAITLNQNGPPGAPVLTAISGAHTISANLSSGQPITLTAIGSASLVLSGILGSTNGAGIEKTSNGSV